MNSTIFADNNSNLFINSIEQRKEQFYMKNSEIVKKNKRFFHSIKIIFLLINFYLNNFFIFLTLIFIFSFILTSFLYDVNLVYNLIKINMTFAQTFFSFFNGMVAGWSQVFVMQPFEIIKVRLQTQSATNKMYSGIVDCLMKIIKNQGFFALYKGSVTPLIGVGILGSMRFGLYQNFKKILAERKGLKNAGQLTTLDKSLSAFLAGCINSFLVCPIEHTRIRIQIQRSEAQKVYHGSIDAVKKIFQQHGIKGLNRGQTPTLIRQSTGLALYFTAIQKITEALTPAGVTDKKNLPVYVPFIAGGIGGTAYWAFNYPFDYVKTLMQTDKLGDPKYKSTIQCFKDNYNAHGAKSFFKGYVICMMRSFPVNAAAIVVYRFMQRISNVATH